MEKKELQIKFLLEEFKALRNEIDDTMKKMSQSFFVILVGSGAIWSLIFTHDTIRGYNNVVKFTLFCMPLILSMFGGFYMYVQRKHLTRMGKFLQRIEIELLETPEELGWEHYMQQFRYGGIKSTEGFENVYSIGLIIINIIGTFIMYRYY